MEIIKDQPFYLQFLSLEGFQLLSAYVSLSRRSLDWIHCIVDNSELEQSSHTMFLLIKNVLSISKRVQVTVFFFKVKQWLD